MDNKNNEAMSRDQQYKFIVDKILADHKDVIYQFAEPVKIKISPHAMPICIHEIAISPDKEIWLLSELKELQLEWNVLEATDINYPVVLATLYQRIAIELELKKVA